MVGQGHRVTRLVLALVAGLCGSLGVSRPASASGNEKGVSTKRYGYLVESTAFEGLLSEPAGKEKIRGGVLVVHNWMGVTDETKKQAERFASLGFVVLSADIYGAGIRPKNAEEAGGLAGTYKKDRLLFRKRLNGAMSELRGQTKLKGKPLFAAGYCFGGTGVVELARSGADVAGVFSFHGGLDGIDVGEGSKGEGASGGHGTKIRGHVVAFHGADDPFVAASDLAAFEKEMATKGVDWQLVKFGGAVHSFTDLGAGQDPTKGAAYNAKADARSWALTKLFLDEWTQSE